jgi:CubicO group peptidase (beta-lactamase class C family)
LIAILAIPLRAETKPTKPDDLTPLLDEIRLEFNLPAIAAGVVNADRTLALGATGLRLTNQNARVTLRDRFHIGSVSKSMTATMIATLVESGTLSWTTTPVDVFPELKATVHPSLRAITLEELLSHRTGIPLSLKIKNLISYQSLLEIR